MQVFDKNISLLQTTKYHERVQSELGHDETGVIYSSLPWTGTFTFFKIMVHHCHPNLREDFVHGEGYGKKLEASLSQKEAGSQHCRIAADQYYTLILSLITSILKC